MTTKVYVIKRTDRRNLVLQWTDPMTGKTRMKSAGTPIMREAQKAAGKLEEAVNAGHILEPTKTEWTILADRYSTEYLGGKARKTGDKFRAIRRHIDHKINPRFASSLTADVLSRFQQTLREAGFEEATIRTSLSALRACFNWGRKIGLLDHVPMIILPKRVNKSKGRPITPGEFQAMLKEVPNEVGPAFAPAITDLLTGLWFSGLRIEEALRLTWEPTTDGFNLIIDPTGVVRIKIEANADKNTGVRLLPLAIDFQRFLLSTPPDCRKGFVFNPTVDGQRTHRMRADTCSKLISRIGEKAQVIVATYRPKKGQTAPRTKFASAHDLRRSFAYRWTDIIPEEHLKELMRHSDIATTRDFYAKSRAERTETALNEAMQRYSDVSSDILPFRQTG